jgi:hypothetical protein
MNKPIKRIAIMDTPSEYVESVLNFVRHKYDFKFTNEYDAEYIFHSIDGFDVLKYNGVRIFFTGENVTPDFSISDYAMAFDKIEFGDRYIWTPLLKYYRDAYQVVRNERPPVGEVVDQKIDFCAYVMSNTKNSASQRTKIFELLSAYKQVNSGGKWRNNVGGAVEDKLAFQSKHKFAIAFENSSSRGYLTEKFVEAAAANAIPIYWGDPDVGKIFNSRAFVNCHDFATIEDAVEHVKTIDQNDALYYQMLCEPWFPDGLEPTCLKDETFAAFLENILDQDWQMAYLRNRSRWGLKMEKRLFDMYHRPHVHGMKLLRKRWRRFCHSMLRKRNSR